MKDIPIVLIHGMWVTAKSWGGFAGRYEGLGHTVLRPSWPGLDGRSVAELRADPSPLEGLGLAEVVDHHERIVRGLDHSPILIGHSFGGLVVLELLDRGLGAAGVAIDSAPPKGVTKLPRSTIKSNWFVLSRPGNRKKAMAMTFEQFRYAFANTMTEEHAAETYERYHIPGSGRMIFEGALAALKRNAPSAVDFRNESRAPLLLIAGEQDNVIPPVITEAIAKKYRKSDAVTDLKEFPGRSHSIIGERGWQEVADYALSWALRNVDRPATPRRASPELSPKEPA